MEPFQEEAQEHLLAVDVNDKACGQRTKIVVRGLRKESDKDVPILRNINLEVPKGVIMGVIGPSGSVGMLFQLPALFEGTVADNIRYGPQLRGKKLSDGEVHKMLKLADLDISLSDRPGSELSVGQAQRVALARTLANEPEVLLLDEPTSALDPISTQNIEDVLVKLKNKQGMTIIMVSHSIKQIQRIADVVCLLVDGEIVESLEPDKLSQAKHPMALRFLQLSS
ncbi:Phosphonate C-P lyase system [Heracleum sosnowskyi]|uniref:Phosphonate C-P lyase system n=1 Tax=Heracleum sosnowskyi TaxID=360622 RepID=A0AAD8M423_9APIA|nr:Phosphonate C-P lyase system [Heracleum sosnowskyi]